MGLIRAGIGAISGGLADSWLETIESAAMDPQTITAPGIKVRPDDRRNTNNKNTADTISNGSIIHINEGQCMLLIDGGKIVDYSAEAGYYKVEDSSLPSLMNGELGPSIKETFNRFRFSGSTPYKQTAFYINTQEVRGIKFGTPNPINYFDQFYNSELFLRCHGTYTIRVVDPIKFYVEVANHDADTSLKIEDINEQYRNEFLTALQSSLNRMSKDGKRISFVLSEGLSLAEYMQDVLDDKWREERGFVIENVGIASISYDEESRKLIDMRNKGAMLGDPAIREGYVQGSIARGLEAAGSNEGGAGQSFLGMGIGMNAMGAGMGQFSQTNMEQMRGQDGSGQAVTTQSGSVHAGWTCPQCGHTNSGNFCSECGSKRPEPGIGKCPECGKPVEPGAKFCPECGHKLG